MGGAPYVTFTADRLDARDAAFLASLPSIYALFQIEGERGDLLRPVDLHPLDRRSCARSTPGWISTFAAGGPAPGHASHGLGGGYREEGRDRCPLARL